MVSVQFDLVERESLGTDTQGERHVKVKAEIGAMFLEAKEHQRSTEDLQKLSKKHGTEFFSQPSELATVSPANNLLLDF